MQLDIDTSIALIRKAQEKEREERWFQQWVSQLPFMAMGGKESFISFPEYCERVSGSYIDMRPATEILAELDEVEKQFEKGGATSGA